MHAIIKSEKQNKMWANEYLGTLVFVVIHDNLNGNNHCDDNKDDEYNEEADPSLFPRRTRRVHRLFGIIQPEESRQISTAVRETKHARTHPASVSFSTVAAVVSMFWIVSSCCSTRTLICGGVSAIFIGESMKLTSLNNCANSPSVCSIRLMSS